MLFYYYAYEKKFYVYFVIIALFYANCPLFYIKVKEVRN